MFKNVAIACTHICLYLILLLLQIAEEFERQNVKLYLVNYSCKKTYYFIFKKYKTFSVLIYSYINTSGNWKNEKLCGNTTPAYQYGKNVLYFFYNIAQRTLKKEWREIFRVDIELYQHGS